MSEEFKVYDNLPDPAPRKRGGAIRTEKYPFSKLEIGQAFVIPVSENHPEPWKSLQSTVSGAQRRFATVDGEKTRRNRKTGTEKTIQNWVPTRKFRLYEIKLEDGSSAAAVKRIA